MATQALRKLTHREVYQVRGEQIVRKVKELVHAGNTRHITVRSADGHVILELPLALGVAAAVLEPTWVALAALAALAADYTVESEHEEADAPA